MNDRPDAHTQPKQRGWAARMTRRAFLLALAAGVAYLIWRPKAPPRLETDKRIIILGFDGADPRLVERYWDRLPNLSALAEQGAWSRLRSSTPPESPVAWSSFAVGGNPGIHGVYDFLRRPSGSYIPTEESFVGRQLPRFIMGGLPIQMPRAVNRRGGTAFWDVLSDNGIPTALLEVPCTFPPPKLHHGHTLSGLGVPDARGMQATFHHFIHAPEDDESLQETVFGGKLERLKKNDDGYAAVIWGPYDPIVDQQKRDKERAQLLAGLEWTEWRAHELTLLGDDAPGESVAMTREFFGKHVMQPFSLFSYLRNDDLRPRLDALRGYFEAGRPFVKAENATLSDARMKYTQYQKDWRELADEIDKLSDPIQTPVRFTIESDTSVNIKVQGETISANIHEWSDWASVSFPVTSLISIHAICRFYVQEIGDRLSIFMSSPDIDPRKPPVPISHPGGFSKELVDWTGGLYKTRGWAAETHGLKDGQLSEDGFISDLLDLMNKREKKTLETLRRTRPNVFVSVFSETDRISHMHMRSIDPQHPLYTPELANAYGNAIEKIFVRMDEIVGRVMEEIKDDTNAILMVMSDHGFQSWRYQVNLNTWLWKNGYMTLKSDSPFEGEMKLDDLRAKDSNQFFRDVDWPRTKAYALGLGQIYINLKGREPIGAVEPGDYQSLCREIADGLLTLNDERPGRENTPTITEVKLRDEIWSGAYVNDEHDCPDMQVGFNEGYRVSWQTCLGGVENEIVSDNLEAWSGDHCSFAERHVPGMFFCNRPVAIENPTIYDFAPTILNHFGLKRPAEMEGRDLFA